MKTMKLNKYVVPFLFELVSISNCHFLGIIYHGKFSLAPPHCCYRSFWSAGKFTVESLLDVGDVPA